MDKITTNKRFSAFLFMLGVSFFVLVLSGIKFTFFEVNNETLGNFFQTITWLGSFYISGQSASDTMKSYKK